MKVIVNTGIITKHYNNNKEFKTKLIIIYQNRMLVFVLKMMRGIGKS